MSQEASCKDIILQSQGIDKCMVQGLSCRQKSNIVPQGSRSYETKVKSGVPQGSVLGTCLFLFYINDQPDMLVSNIRLFAGDTVVYLAIG